MLPATSPPDGREIAEGVLGYLIGLGLAILLTAVSFFIAGTFLVWRPSVPIALVVLAIAQIGVHLVFFLHITTGPDNVNNVLGAGVRRPDRHADHGRVALDHVQPQSEHDADAHGDGIIGGRVHGGAAREDAVVLG